MPQQYEVRELLTTLGVWLVEHQADIIDLLARNRTLETGLTQLEDRVQALERAGH